MFVSSGVFESSTQQCLARHVSVSQYGQIDVERGARLLGVQLHGDDLSFDH
jgi:hypothetical protein